MRLIEELFIVIALSLNVFLFAQYEGANFRKLEKQEVMRVCLIFIVGQMVSFSLGYLITRLPFFLRAGSADLQSMCYMLTAIIFLLIGGYMLYRCRRREDLEERLRDLRYRRIAVEAGIVAVYTFACGIGCGFLNVNLVITFILVAFITILAVVIGLYTGYYQGYRFRKAGYGASCVLFLAAGVEILIRYF